MARTNALNTDFSEQTITLRGETYRLRELSIGEYDELVIKATTTRPSPITGEEEERLDNALLLKLMVLKCLVEPKLTAEGLASRPMRVVLKLNQTVNRMHYGDEPEEKKAETSEPEETAKGND